MANTFDPRNHAPIQTLGLARVPLEKLCTANDLKLRLPIRLPMLNRYRMGNLVDPFPHQSRGAQHHIATLTRRDLAPDTKPNLSCIQRIIKIQCRCNRNPTDLDLICRVYHGQGIRSLAPRATNKK